MIKEKQHVSSARETKVLQCRGIEQIQNLANDRQVPLPKIYGFVQHYHFSDLWGATSMEQHCKNGTSSYTGPPGNAFTLLVNPTFQAVGMNYVFKNKSTCITVGQ
jgi:hypothetical protein